MRRKLVNSGLLWKEWKENWKIFILAMIIMCWDTILNPLIAVLSRIDTSEALVNWGDVVNNMVFYSIAPSNDIYFVIIGPFICLFLGVFILSRERHGSLEYLLATPLSRKEIIGTKFLIGALAILGIAILQAAFLLWAYYHLPGIVYEATDITNWLVRTYPTLLAMFTLGLLSSTLAGTTLSSCIIAFCLIALPFFIYATFINPLLDPIGRLLLGTNNYIGKITAYLINHTSFVSDFFEQITSYCTLPLYIGREGRHPEISNYLFQGGIWGIPDNFLHMIDVLDIYFIYENLFLLLIIALLFLLALKAFDVNPMERKKRRFVLPIIQYTAIVLVPISVAQIFMLKLHGKHIVKSMPGYVLGFCLTTIFVFIIIRLLINKFTNQAYLNKICSFNGKKFFKISAAVIAGTISLGLIIYASFPILMMKCLALGSLSTSVIPQLDQMPISRTLKLCSLDNSKSHVSSMGVSFATPWDGCIKEDSNQGYVRYSFQGGREISVSKKQAIPYEIEWLYDRENIQLQNLIYDGSQPSTIYEMLAPILKSTPDQVKLGMPHKEAERALLLIILKGDYYSENPGKTTCHLTTPFIDAIQEPADIDHIPQWIIYDDRSSKESNTQFSDDHHNVYSVSISGDKLSQEEVDAIIGSIKINC